MSFPDGVGVGDEPGAVPGDASAARWLASSSAPLPASAAAVAPIAAPNSALLLIAIAATHAIADADLDASQGTNWGPRENHRFVPWSTGPRSAGCCRDEANRPTGTPRGHRTAGRPAAARPRGDR